MTVRAIEKHEKDIIKSLVDIHMRTFDGFFLTFLGKGFLYQMYRSYCEHEPSILYGAFDDSGKIIGFLAASSDMSGLYKYMIKSKLLQFAWYAFLGFLRKPSAFFKLLSAFTKSGESKREEKYVQLSSIGVDPDYKSMGIGSQLIGELIANVNFEDVAYISLETDAVDNEPANHFYQKNGFVLAREYETKEGRKMNEYHFGGVYANTNP